MMHPDRIVVLAQLLGVGLLAAVAATGCGAASSGSGPGGGGNEIPPSVAQSAQSGPPPLPGSSPPSIPSLVPITPAPGQRERVAQWHLAGQSDGGRRLLIDVAIGGPPCDAVTGLDVTETGTTVKVTVHAGRLVSADCPAGSTGALATARVVATLDQPLGNRDLLGGIV